MKNIEKVGKIKMITGCMFSGKSEELLRIIRQIKIAGILFKIFTYDTGYRSTTLTTHDGKTIEVLPMTNAALIPQLVPYNVMVVGIDNAHLFGLSIKDCVDTLLEHKKQVIVSGLDMDFRGQPFEPIAYLMGKADDVKKLHAICTVCGKEAVLTQRLINGVPAKHTDPLIMIGGEVTGVTYEARCRLHHVMR